VRASVTELLNEEGYSVHEAENGARGIEKARTVRPDLIISDILMPEKNGYQVLSELREYKEFSNVPFIFLTAKSSVADIRNGMSVGADDYLFKPFRSNDLLNAIKTRLEKKYEIDKKFDELSTELSLIFPHELRTPLVAILGYSQILREEAHFLTKEEAIEMSSRIEIAGNRLLNNIQKFLAYTELQAVLLSPLRKFIEENGTKSAELTIRSVAAAMAKKYEREEDLHFNIRDSALDAPERFLGHAVEEIIENSFKYSDNHTPVIITAFAENGKYRIIVEDAGWGMTAEQVSALTMNKQSHKSKSPSSGFGFGISIARKIADVFDGSFNMTSALGGKTVVELTFPIINK